MQVVIRMVCRGYASRKLYTAFTMHYMDTTARKNESKKTVSY